MTAGAKASPSDSVQVRRGEFVSSLGRLTYSAALATGGWLTVFEVFEPSIPILRPTGQLGWWLWGVFATVMTLMAVAAVKAAVVFYRPAYLVIDHEGMRLDTGRARPRWRLGWTELAGVGLVVNRRARLRARTGPNRMPVSWTEGVELDLFPADPAALWRHRELTWAWLHGRGRRWRLRLGVSDDDLTRVRDLVQRHRAQLWLGEISGHRP